MRRRRPPFANRWLAGRPLGSVRIFIGSVAWQRARDSRVPALVAPLDVNPSSLDWGFLHGRDAILIQCGRLPGEYLQETGERLVRAGVSPVVVILEGGRSVVFKPREGVDD